MNAIVKTFPENNKCAVVEIDGVGTMSMIGFAQKMYNAGAIDYKTYHKSRKIAFSSDFATQLVKGYINLFI